MSLEDLKQEAAALDEPSQRQLFAFLVSLREKQWAAQARKVALNLDDPDPNRWLTLEEFSARLERDDATDRHIKILGVNWADSVA